MGKKVKDFLREINKYLASNELEALASASSLDGAEITDDGFNTVTDKMKQFLTLEAAQNNSLVEDHFRKKLYPIIKGELLGNIDTEIDAVAKQLFGEKASDILTATFTKDKVKKFNTLSQEVLASKLKDSDKQALLDQYAKQINDLQGKHADELKKKDEEFHKKESEFHTSIIKAKFMELAKGYKLQDAYQKPDIQNLLLSGFFDKIASQATLKLNPAGEIEVYEKDDPLRQKFEGSKKIGVKDLLDPVMQDYINKAPGKPAKGEKGKETTNKRDLPSGTLLADLQAAREVFNDNQ